MPSTEVRGKVGLLCWDSFSSGVCGNIQVERSDRQLDVWAQYRAWEGDFRSEDLNLGIIRMEALTKACSRDELT